MADKKLICTVVSCVPFGLREEKPGLIPGIFVIPAALGEDPQILHVGSCRYYVYLDEDRGCFPVDESPEVVARAIVEDYSMAQLATDENARPAIFWVPGELSLEEVKIKHKSEIQLAKARQNAWFLNLCRIADDDWHRYHQHKAISDFQRFAAQRIGWNPDDHAWMIPEALAKTKKCPACRNDVPEDAIVCQCRCILNPEEYKKLQFVPA